MSSRILTGDCRTMLATLPAESVQMACTSPPYFALRSYLDGNDPNKPLEIGSETSPDAYVSALVDVFRGVKRVLRDDGLVFINLGDLYIDKQLQMMPARVAFALQADGWWLRSAIVWHKPNPMPESCKGRPTSSYEMVFMLAKAERYFYDAEAVREENSPTGASYGKERRVDAKVDASRRDAKGINAKGRDPGAYWGLGRNARNVWTIATQPFSASKLQRGGGGGTRRITSPDCPIHGGSRSQSSTVRCDERRAASLSDRSPNTDVRLDPEQQPVRVATPIPSGEATSFDTEDCSDQKCSAFATPRSMQNHRTDPCPETSRHGTHGDRSVYHIADIEPPLDLDGTRRSTPSSNTGSGALTCSASPRTADDNTDTLAQSASFEASGSPVCSCEHTTEDKGITDHYAVMPPELAERCILAGSRPGDTVLDPFAGAGTTLLVADRLQRDAVGIELNPTYAAMARDRVSADAPLFAEVAD